MPDKVKGVFEVYSKQSLLSDQLLIGEEQLLSEQEQIKNLMAKLEQDYYCDLVKQKLHPTAKQDWTKQD